MAQLTSILFSNSITTDADKLKFQNLLQKKVEIVENFGIKLVEQEKQFLSIHKLQTKVFKKLRIGTAKKEAGLKKSGTEGAEDQYEL